jgi:hypothetical protein
VITSNSIKEMSQIRRLSVDESLVKKEIFRFMRVLIFTCCCLQGLMVLGADKNSLAFKAGNSNEFTFNTGSLRGTLRAGGASKGLTSVVHIPTGVRLDSSMGLFSHYRMLGANTRYGTAGWFWPSEAKLQADGAVEEFWPAAPEHPFELKAVYRWVSANALELETTVKAYTNLNRFECFLASYFTPDFTNSIVYVEGKKLMHAQKEAGAKQAFPRDTAGIEMIQDGRWEYEPYPIDWVIMPKLEKPMGIRRAPGLGITAVLMGRPEECFAVYTPHETEGHFSMYLGFFGRDLKAGGKGTARARLLIGDGISDEKALQAYEEFLRSTR